MVMDSESETPVSVVPTLNSHAAKRMLEHAEGVAEKMSISGFFVVFSRTGMQEASLAIGDKGTPLNVSVALDKIKTVLATRCSTSVQRRLMKQEGLDRADLAGQLGSLLSGGVAVFQNGQFIGAIAFSGAPQEVDEECCVRIVEAAGLETDIQEGE
jgi:uncharacterized protein GlcG (DUF336 family)